MPATYSKIFKFPVCIVSIVAASTIFLANVEAFAVAYSFQRSTEANQNDVTGFLSMDVSEVLTGKVKFTISFASGAAGDPKIGDISFDDEVDREGVKLSNLPTPAGIRLSSFSSFDPSAGVAYKQDKAGNVPEGNKFPQVDGTASPLSPEFKSTFSFKKDGGQNEIHEGESLGIIFELASGKTFNDVLAALNSGNLRVALHMQALEATASNPTSGSDSYVNGPVTSAATIPEAGTSVLLLGIGLCTVGLAGRASKGRV